LERLLRTLIEVVLAHSGAERGCFLFVQDGALSVEAEAAVDASGTVVRLERHPVHPAQLPASILQFVWRTGETVVLADAAAEARLGSDEYIARSRPRSVLCQPIRKQSEVTALVYLENNALSGAFTPRRLTVLELLAAQAAISLENARHLALTQAARAEAEDAGRRSALLA